MKKKHYPLAAAILLAAILCFAVVSRLQQSAPDAVQQPGAGESRAGETDVTVDGTYTSPEEVAAYIHTFGGLPENFITKDEAHRLGWDEHDGNLWDVAPGKSIGGSHYGNYEGGLPDADGRKWKECDVNYSGGYRGAERILYSNDGLVYYTGDHYQTFTQLY